MGNRAGEYTWHLYRFACRENWRVKHQVEHFQKNVAHCWRHHHHHSTVESVLPSLTRIHTPTGIRSIYWPLQRANRNGNIWVLACSSIQRHRIPDLPRILGFDPANFSRLHTVPPLKLQIDLQSFLELELIHSEINWSIMSDPKYAYPYPAQGYPQGYYQQPPPVVAPPVYSQGRPRRDAGFLEGCLAALCCCCLLDECCCDPSIIFMN